MQLGWTAASGASSYNLYYSTIAGAGTTGTKVAGITNPYTITGLSDSVTYYFVITATNAAGEGTPSVEVSEFYEGFNSDVFASGKWFRTDSSVSVDLSTGVLRINSDGIVSSGFPPNNGYAWIVINAGLPVTVTARMRLVSGGQNYLLPYLLMFYDSNHAVAITYLPGSPYGFGFGVVNLAGWTNSQSNAPSVE